MENWVLGFLFFLSGFFLGGIGVYFFQKKRGLALEASFEAEKRRAEEEKGRREELEQRLKEQEIKVAEQRVLLEQKERFFEKELEKWEQIQQQLEKSFQSLSSEVLEKNSQSLLRLAKENFSHFHEKAKGELESKRVAVEHLIQPIEKKLAQFDEKLGDLERARLEAYEGLRTQLEYLLKDQLPRLRQKTEELVNALKQPRVRGRWGEIQLRRVVEIAGMQKHCDFEEQVSHRADSGTLRPDMVVHLPGGRLIVVDSKVPLEAYLRATEAKDEEEQKRALQQHAMHLRAHIQKLSDKSYFEQFRNSPEFVILFIPGEAFFSAALLQDHTLLEFGMERRVIPASPTTLIAVLKSVAYGWRQEAVAQNAKRVAQLGQELYKSLATLSSHWSSLGRSIRQVVQHYNSATGSLDRNVLAKARRFRELNIIHSGKEVEEPQYVEGEMREFSSSEFSKERMAFFPTPPSKEKR